jgi:hypothetical protein
MDGNGLVAAHVVQPGSALAESDPDHTVQACRLVRQLSSELSDMPEQHGWALDATKMNDPMNVHGTAAAGNWRIRPRTGEAR